MSVAMLNKENLYNVQEGLHDRAPTSDDQTPEGARWRVHR